MHAVVGGIDEHGRQLLVGHQLFPRPKAALRWQVVGASKALPLRRIELRYRDEAQRVRMLTGVPSVAVVAAHPGPDEHGVHRPGHHQPPAASKP